MKFFSTIILLFLATCLSAQSIKPYLQTPTPNSVWVNWKTAITGTPMISYGISPATMNLQQTGTTESLSDPGYAGPYHYHSVKLTGLAPNTGYYYQANLGSETSDIHFFRTPPLYGNNNDTVRLLILGDHQIRNQPRYDSLVVASKRKIQEKYGSPAGKHVSLILNTGDQVDLGNLDHYENIHYKKSSYISPDIPIMCAVGNHETYGALGMTAYYKHFIYDELTYQGISSNTENYYAYQMANVLVLMLSTEHPNTIQRNWAFQVIDSAKNDPNVDWIIAVGHRPYQAEQYIGDISNWVKSDILPKLQETEKFVLFVGAHHHVYSRGQFEEFPAYHIISGGTAWNQYWGMSTERDYAETQKTLPQWAYQLVEFDNVHMEMHVETYSIGSIYRYKNNQLVDTFYRKPGLQGPIPPFVSNQFEDSLRLPFDFASSAYQHPLSIPYNSTQFQISQFEDFHELEINKLRDFENYYGMAGGEPDSTRDIFEGVDIFQMSLDSNELVNGMHYIRVRHRDRNLVWSDWSTTDSFKVFGSVSGNPSIRLNKDAYELNESIDVTYRNGPGHVTDWVGLYKKGDIPGQVGSTTWAYVEGKNGTLNFTLGAQNEYFAAYFELDGYTEIAPRVPFWVGAIPVLNLDTSTFALGESVVVEFTNGPSHNNDWIGIYKVGYEPGTDTSYVAKKSVAGPAGAATFLGLPKGYYYATYHVNDGYFEPGERIYFSVGDTIAEIITDKSIYNLGEDIVVYFSDGPGTAKDWLGIYESSADPNVDYLYSYVYVDGRPEGDTLFTDINPDASNILPDTAGDYFVVLFINDSYDEVSNRVYFSVADPGTSIEFFNDGSKGVKMYPNPVKDYAVLDSRYPIHQVSLFDIHGRLMMTMKDLQENQVKINRESLPAGTYVLNVYSDKVYQFRLNVE